MWLAWLNISQVTMDQIEKAIEKVTFSMAFLVPQIIRPIYYTVILLLYIVVTQQLPELPDIN